VAHDAQIRDRVWCPDDEGNEIELLPPRLLTRDDGSLVVSGGGGCVRAWAVCVCVCVTVCVCMYVCVCVCVCVYVEGGLVCWL